MFTLHWAETAADTFEDLQAKAEHALETSKASGKSKSSKPKGLFKQVHKTIELLQANPKHPGLRTHEYDAIANPYKKGAKVFEAYAQNETPRAYRVFWCYGPGKKDITILAITPHP